jgi:tellurite resistance-related uncharacterized protein
MLLNICNELIHQYKTAADSIGRLSVTKTAVSFLSASEYQEFVKATDPIQLKAHTSNKVIEPVC